MKKVLAITLSILVGFMAGYFVMWHTAKTATDEAGMLSDIIRQYSDHNPDSDILDYFNSFKYDKEKLLDYSYAY